MGSHLLWVLLILEAIITWTDWCSFLVTSQFDNCVHTLPCLGSISPAAIATTNKSKKCADTSRQRKSVVFWSIKWVPWPVATTGQSSNITICFIIKLYIVVCSLQSETVFPLRPSSCPFDCDGAWDRLKLMPPRDSGSSSALQTHSHCLQDYSRWLSISPRPHPVSHAASHFILEAPFFKD